jgi:NAD(P)-dependent dehydrogenase (short-subunit alcohol dehydrogenase family)
MDFQLRGRHALITGASGNLGGAIATALAMQGVSVSLLYGSERSEASTKTLADRLSCLDDVDACALFGDVTRDEGISQAVEQTLNRFGSLEIVVNNAGIFTTASHDQIDEHTWDRVFDINMKGMWRVNRYTFDALYESKGAVVQVCSINAFRPGFGHTVHYDASKGAVAAYTRSLAAEYAPYGIRVNGVAPGLLDAQILHERAPDLVDRYESRSALHRLVKPDEIASIVCFLASEASSAMVGEILVADCGYGMM